MRDWHPIAVMAGVVLALATLQLVLDLQGNHSDPALADGFKVAVGAFCAAMAVVVRANGHGR